ncbi:MAG: Unknown protein [uncultured Aureispira sp.]|uniref:Uncharacterized protein n=1 Tax=uncultured Aureispira sp. TaxID=1331704 RepID=A0A6S6UIX9_9BACT|nr:MAG: Unknown protein [uncultured Aureispira sp.]
MKRRTKVLLILAIFIQICSYFLPFLGSSYGYQFFKKGIAAFLSQGIQAHNWYAFYAFFAPIFSFPILLMGLFKPFSSSMRMALKLGLGGSLLCPVLLSVCLVFPEFNSIGYLFWGASVCFMYGLFLFKKALKIEVDVDDLNKHLIENEL